MGKPGDGAAVCAMSADHLAPYVDRLCALRGMNVPEHGTFTAQSQKEKGLA